MNNRIILKIITNIFQKQVTNQVVEKTGIKYTVN